MKLRTYLAVPFILALLPFLLALQASPDVYDPGMAETVASVDSLFERWDSSERPGCAVAVSEEGRPLLARAYGMADLEHSVPNTPSTIFEAGSVSKQFTAAAIVLLSLDGKLDLDFDVRQYVPELADYGETITLRHLLTHTSGLRDWGSVAAISGWGRGNRTHDHDHVLDILTRQEALNFPPGEYYSYSNSGYNILAMIVERVSGQAFADFSKERIFEPLGMTNTQWRDDYTRIVKGRSAAYSARNDSTFYINRPIEHVHGNGGLLTTVHDLLIWNHALSTGRLGGDLFVDAMHETGMLNSGRPIHYGMGLQHVTALGLPVIQHTGATSGYRAYLARFPEQEVSVSLLCNVTNANPGRLGTQVAEVFLGSRDEDEGNSSPAPVDIALDALEEKAGLYQDPLNGNPVALIVEDDALRIKDGPALRPISETAFQVGSGERVFIFEEGSEGPAITMEVDGYGEGTLLPVEDFDPSDEELRAFAGTYWSEDAETELTVRVEEGQLVAERRPGRIFELEPVYTDAFEARGLGLLRFERESGGRVSAFTLSRGRVFAMPFERVE